MSSLQYVKCSTGDVPPANALQGGFDGGPSYHARGVVSGKTIPGKVDVDSHLNGRLKGACIPYGSRENRIHSFEVLTSELNISYVRCKTGDKPPENAVQGGYDGGPSYHARGLVDGKIIPGKVGVILESEWELKGACIAYGGKEHRINDFEVLVIDDAISHVEFQVDKSKKIRDASNTEIPWKELSEKHSSKLSKLAEILKTEPSKTRKFGVYSVCLDEQFCIGDGSDRTFVYVGLSDDGYEVAVKRLNLKKGRELSDNEERILNCPKVRNEKHIVNYRYHHIDNSKEHFIVLDLHEESLRDYVLDEVRPVEKLREEGPRIIREILYGVKALHCGNPEILHRDLKPQNILVNLRGEMVLADFGISRTLSEEETTYKSGVSGTEGWMAVESLPNENDDKDYLSYADIQVRYKKQSDIQVVGMLCYYVLTKGKHPYGKRILRNYHISQGKFDLKDLSDPCAKDLITWMLQHDPAERPNVHQCLKHPYLRTAEENFNLVVSAGNEREIKTTDATSIVVQELNKIPGLTNWLHTIDKCVFDHMTAARRSAYTYDAAALLRFIRNMATHWNDKTPPANIQTTVVNPQEYFEKKFPTLPVELHRILRRYPDWTTRENLKDFF